MLNAALEKRKMSELDALTPEVTNAALKNRGGRIQKYPTLLKYCVLCPHGEREGRNSYLAWPDSAMTPTLKSSQIATLAAWLSLRSGHRATVRAEHGGDYRVSVTN